jgi:hypothetical protein
LARSLGFSEGDIEAAPRGEPCRRASGLNASVAPFRVGAHEEKDDPTSGACKYDSHDTSSLNSLVASIETAGSFFTSARRF